MAGLVAFNPDHRALRVPAWLPGLGLYFALAATSAREVGLVGEVAIGWGASAPPRVLTDLDPPAAEAPRAWGPFVASQSRPMERLQFGSLEVPLAINSYTGGLADLPARVVSALAGWQAGAFVGVALGGLLLVLAARFVTIHVGELAGGLGALVLGSDWSFVFFKRVLSGTEVLLQAGALLTVWALWSRRWRGGVHGTFGIALGVAFGLCAKATFVPVVVAIALAALLTRRDRPAVSPPVAVRWPLLLGLPLVGLAPLILANLHATALPVAARVHSHDTLAMQFSRWSAPSAARESAGNLVAFFGDPNAFWSWALHADAVPELSVGRAVSLLVVLWGSVLSWTDRRGAPSPGDALLRFLSVLCPLATGLLFLANHDLHHLAQASVFWGLWTALSAVRVAALAGRPRSLVRAVVGVGLCAPSVIAGVHQLGETDSVLATAPQSTFRESGQRALLDLLASAQVQRLVTSDYEVYGMVDIRAPGIDLLHTWAAFSRKVHEPWRVLQIARGGHYLSLRATAPMIYNWSPTPEQVRAASLQAGVHVEPAGELKDGDAVWASLWRVE